MILSPHLLKFTIQQSSDWHMVVSGEKTVRLGSRSMLTLRRHLWKELIESDLCIPSQYGFSLDVVLFPHRESPRCSPQGQPTEVDERDTASSARELGHLSVAEGCSGGAGAFGQGSVAPRLRVKVLRAFEWVRNGCVEGQGLGFGLMNKFFF